MITLTSCKPNEKINQCFVEGNIINRAGEFDRLMSEIILEIDEIGIVKISSFDADELTGTTIGNTDFNVKTIKSIIPDSFEYNNLSFRVYCVDDSNKDEEVYIANYSYGGNVHGKILLDSYYLVFVTNGANQSIVEFYYKLDNYDESKAFDDQNDYINELINSVVIEVVD